MKNEIRFYHLEHHGVKQALPGLLEKALIKYPRILVQMDDKTTMKPLSDHLWSYRENAFLPHGLAGKDYEDKQPILLDTDNAANKNDAPMVVLLGQSKRSDIESFNLSCIMFDGTNTDELTHARETWRILKDGYTPMTYWQQGDTGWVKKAEANMGDNAENTQNE